MKRVWLVRGGVMVLGICVLALLLTDDAQADWPPPDDDQLDLSDSQYWPNDPDYGSTWEHFSFLPADTVDAVTAYSPYEVAIGSGVHADRAWQKTTGDRRVIIAVLDSGIRWREPELVNKYYLNAAELPPPDAGCTGDGTVHDVNGDGYFNVQDYTTNTGTEQPVDVCDTVLLAHPGGWDVNGNGFLDPQDLIAIHSDGIDDDLNGWIDDISGWDIYQDDNDPHDDTDDGHGTGEAKWSSAEGNNGRSSLGTCPSCSVLMIRSGESFMTDVNDFAMSTIFAVDSGVSVVQSAQGAVNNTKFSQDAIDYAWNNDVTVVVSAADEDSFHQNYPGSVNHTVYVHSIQHNTPGWRDAETFMNFCNCTNYGAQLLMSTPGSSCSSEAVGRTAGLVGLLYSMALREDLAYPDGVAKDTDLHGARRLRADEARQLLLTTVDDIHDPATAGDPERYETKEGWEMRFGYGRPNVGRAVRQIEAGRIPPVADIVSPTWFAPLYPDQTPSVDILGEVSFRESIYDSVDWVLEWAPGIEPDDGDYTTIASGDTVTQPVSGVLASWDISGITVDNPDMPEPDRHVNRYMVTLRLRVTTNSTNSDLDGVRGELRKAVHIHRDADLLPGFPMFIGASGESPIKTEDVDGDGVREIVYVDADGWVNVIQGDGSYLSGWPKPVNVMPHIATDNPENHRDTAAFASGGVDADYYSSLSNTAPAIADLDGDGEMEVIVANIDGFVHVLDPAGNPVPGFPVTLDRSLGAVSDRDNNVDSGIYGSPAVEDMDGDGDYEIVVSGLDGHVYMWHHNGDLDPGFPVKLMLAGDEDFAQSVSSPALGDVDGDGSPDILVGSNQSKNEQGSFWAIHADGNDHSGGPFLEGFPLSILSVNLLPVVGQGVGSSPALADIDGDGVLEIGISGLAGPPRVYDGEGYIYRAMQSGTMAIPENAFGPLSDSQDMPLQVFFTNPIFADFNNDGRLNMLQGGGGLKIAAAFASGGTRIDFDHLLGAWDVRSERFLHAFPRRMEDYQFFMSPAVADIDGDDVPEAINGSAGYYLHAWNRFGVEPAGWPKFTGGWIISCPAVGDVDGDGQLEVMAATRSGWLFAWNTTGSADGRIEWPSHKHDPRNTGNYHTPLNQGTLELPYDDDLDGDGIPNAVDDDVDGDGVLNVDDDDVDGDSVPNDWDWDDDGDGIDDDNDDTPQGVETTDPTDNGGGKGCGCTAGSTPDAGLPLILLLGLLLLGVRRLGSYSV